MLVSCSAYFLPWRWRRYVPPKRRLTLNRLHGVISQKMVLFKIQYIVLGSWYWRFILCLGLICYLQSMCNWPPPRRRDQHFLHVNRHLMIYTNVMNSASKWEIICLQCIARCNRFQ
jgi:hypothetical protein